MKKTIKLAVVAALALGATSAFATNGDVMIGQGAKSRSMGGVGIAKSFGAESGLANPAMIASVEKSEATLVVTAFAPNVSASSFGQAETDSGSNFSVIPELAYATRVTDNTVIGISVSGTAGMGVDYSDEPVALGNNTMQMKTALSLLKVAVPVSYQIDGFTLGVAGILQYGSLELRHQNPFAAPGSYVANGASTDIGYGLEFGASYDMKNIGVKGLTVAAVYKSEIGMTYDNTIGASVTEFNKGGATGITSGDDLAQPEERGVGVSYSIGANTISADYKNIAWGDATGYSDFGWEDQDVYAVGYEYAADNFAVRLGYNYAKNPIVEQDTSGANIWSGTVKNFFNMSGFPGIVETHYTIGGGYSVSEALDIDAAFIYVPETTATYDISAYGAGSKISVKHSQMGLTIAGTYKF